MAWHVYLARCGDGTLYTGITTDPARREAAHNAGRGASYTRARRPVRLVHLEPAVDRGAPLRPLVEEMDVRLARIAPEIVGDPRRSVFRIHRDVRFSADKSPYKTNAA